MKLQTKKNVGTLKTYIASRMKEYLKQHIDQ